MSQQRVAVLISYRDDDVFKNLREKYERPRELESGEYKFSVFFIAGRKSPAWLYSILDFVETLRYRKLLWLVLRLYDSLALRISAKKIRRVEVNKDGIIQVDCPDDLRHLGIKMYAAYKWCTEENFDFIVRTTLSTVVNITNLKKFLTERDKTFLYAGLKLPLKNRDAIVSGGFTIFNKNGLLLLLSLSNKHNHGVLDDVAIGKLLTGKLEPTFCESTVIEESFSYTEGEMLAIEDSVVIRCKSFTEVRNDFIAMNKVKKYLIKNNFAVI